MDIGNFNKVKEAYHFFKRKIYYYGRDMFCCFRKTPKRKNSDPLTAFYNPYYDPEFTELREVVVVPNDKIGENIINKQPCNINFSTFLESSDDEIIFEKEKKEKHIVEINEDNTFNEIFNDTKKRRLSYDLNLSIIQEDIDSSIERTTPISPVQKPFISSPVENMGFDDLEEEFKHNLSKSNISIKSVNIGDKYEDNWDLLEN
jgi:hypothetical protein